MPKASIKGLGEIALRVTDLDAMQRFYQDVIGLPLLKRFEKAAFFKIADGYGGHAQVLALFDRAGEPGYAGLNPPQRPSITWLSRSTWPTTTPSALGWNGWASKSRLPSTPGSTGGACTCATRKGTRSSWFATMKR